MKSDVENGSWSYEEAFALTGHGRYNYQVLITCSIISVAMALDMFGFAITVAAASCDLDLSVSQIGLLAGSPFAGLLFAYPWGYYADTRGRRQAMLLSTSVGFVFAVIGSFSVNGQIMLALKIIGSSFSTASFSLTMTYLGETNRKKKTGQYIYIMMSMNLATEVFSFGLAYFILPLTFTYSIPWLYITFNSWRLYSLTLATPLGVSALLLLLLQESPKFLADKGDEEKAVTVLRNIFIKNGGKETDFPVISLHSTACQDKEDSLCTSLTRQMAPLFKPPLLWRTLQLFYLISLTCSINNAFLMWFPTMLDIVFKSLSSGTGGEIAFCDSITEATVPHGNSTISCSGTITEQTIYSGILASLFISVINLSVARFAAWRRLILITVLATAGVSCAMIALLKQPIASVIFFALAQITAVGNGSIASYFVDLYPTSCRGLAPSLGFMMGRLVSLIAVIVIGATIINYCNAIFYTFSILAICHGRYNYQVLITCSIISVAMALDMFGFAITVAAATCDLDLSVSQIGLLAGSPFAGLLFAYPWGYYADTRGRRQAMLLSTSVGFVFAVIGSFSVNWQMMLALKIIGCSFSTASFSLTMTYLGESTREKKRGQYIFIMMSMNLATEVFSFGLAYLILPLTFTYSIPWLYITFSSWRLYSLTLATPLGVGALLMLLLQESPKFLADKGDEEKAVTVLRNIFIVNGGKETEFPVISLHSTVCQDKEDSLCASLTRQMAQLFKPPLLWRTLQLFYLISLTCSINNAFVMWFPTMLDIVFKSLSSGTGAEIAFCDSITEVTVPHGNSTISCSGTISDETIYSGILASLFFSVINLSVAKFATWRRLILITVLATAGVSCAMIALLKQPIASVIFFTLAQITAVGNGSIASYFVDLYPTSCRGLAPSLGFMMGRLVSLIAVIVIGATIINYCNAIFYTFSILAISGACVALLLP